MVLSNYLKNYLKADSHSIEVKRTQVSSTILKNSSLFVLGANLD